MRSRTSYMLVCKVKILSSHLCAGIRSPAFCARIRTSNRAGIILAIICTMLATPTASSVHCRHDGAMWHSERGHSERASRGRAMRWHSPTS
eukprot:jgi/Mesvir1/27496/Mv26391-RA.1